MHQEIIVECDTYPDCSGHEVAVILNRPVPLPLEGECFVLPEEKNDQSVCSGNGIRTSRKNVKNDELTRSRRNKIGTVASVVRRVKN